MIKEANKPIIYTGGGIINSGDEASELLKEFVDLVNFPVTNTLMGLGGFDAFDDRFVGMLGMHGTYEANMAMHDCDLMINIGARFDDRVTGRVDAFSPGSKKIHIDIDDVSIDKIIDVDLAIISDAKTALRGLIKELKDQDIAISKQDNQSWWDQVKKWRDIRSLSYEESKDPENTLLTTNLKGNNLAMTPKYTANISYTHTFNLGEYGFIHGWFNASWKDKSYSTVWNLDKHLDDMDFAVSDEATQYIDDSRDAFAVYNASLKYEPQSQKWYAELFINNASDETIQYWNNTSKGVPKGSFGMPRYYGVRAGFSF